MTPQIVYEKGIYWVARLKDGTYEVNRQGATCSTRCAQIGYKGAEGLEKAKYEVARRIQKDSQS